MSDTSSLDRLRQISEQLDREDYFNSILLDFLHKQDKIGICLVNTNLEFLYVNNVLAKINGFPIEKYYGNSIYKLLPNIGDKAFEAYDKVIKTKEPCLDNIIEGSTNSKDKDIYVVNYYPVTKNDELKGIITTVIDITDMKIRQDLSNNE